MDLLEHQGKKLLADYGVPTPSGAVAKNPAEAKTIAEDLGTPVVVKAQVQIGGRGKAGGIKVASDAGEAESHAEAILGMDIRGHTVHEVWIERASDIESEYYASIVFDRGAKKPLLMLSTMGGVDIEQVAADHPEKIAKLHIDPFPGFEPFHARRAAFEAGIDTDVMKDLSSVLGRLYEAFRGLDSMLIEINPLVITKDREVVALDAKVSIDENAIYRQPEIAEMSNPAAEDPQEQMAKEKGLTYVKLDGSIGILGNGAGLVMSTLDVVAQAGGEPANFLDVGGGANAEDIVESLKVILSDKKVKAILFNIFGGITRCDEVATGVLDALDQLDVNVPIVVRLDGTNDKEGRALLSEAAPEGLDVEATMLGAANKVVELAV